MRNPTEESMTTIGIRGRLYRVYATSSPEGLSQDEFAWIDGRPYLATAREVDGFAPDVLVRGLSRQDALAIYAKWRRSSR